MKIGNELDIDLRKEAERYMRMSLKNPLTDDERKSYRKIMEKLYGRDNIRRALGEIE